MSSLLEKALEKVVALPADEQDETLPLDDLL
jgi:hypothetical protein